MVRARCLGRLAGLLSPGFAPLVRGCGGSDAAGNSVGAALRLLQLTLATIGVGVAQQLKAMGTYSDDSTRPDDLGVLGVFESDASDHHTAGTGYRRRCRNGIVATVDQFNSVVTRSVSSTPVTPGLQSIPSVPPTRRLTRRRVYS